jgi:pimeloyl-ACP methyl ester carboxylesterase
VVRRSRARDRPGLVLWVEGDLYAASRFGARRAERTGARFVCFPGCSHWWQLERPAAVAAELDRFWTHIRPAEPRDA